MDMSFDLSSKIKELSGKQSQMPMQPDVLISNEKQPAAQDFLSSKIKTLQQEQAKQEPVKPLSFTEKVSQSMQDEDLQREIERGQAQVTSRMFERLFGLPGDIIGLVSQVSGAKPIIQPPTSTQLQQFSEEISKGYTKPKTEFERRAGEFAGDIASFIPGGGATPLKMISRIVGVPLIGQIAEETSKALGAKPNAQQYTKYGSMLLSDIILGRGKGTKKRGFDLLNEAKASIPKNAMADASKFIKTLDALEAELSAGVSGPHKSDALKAIKDIKSQITPNNEIPANLFTQIREDINKIIDSKKGFQIGGEPPKTRKAAVSNLQKVKNEVISTANEWGKKNAPDFAKKWSEANEILAVSEKSKQMADLFSKLKINNPVAQFLLGIKYPGLIMTGKITQKALEKVIPPAIKYVQSPAIRKIYNNIMKEALKGNVQNVARLASKFDKLADKKTKEE
jgi:hypothetical protein